MSQFLQQEQFLAVVRDAPLVAMDLVVKDENGSVLTGLRRNAPAQGFWFVPGGRIRKGETLDVAFSRLCHEELGLMLGRSQAEWLGLYEHFYSENFALEPGISTHYVVLAWQLCVRRADLDLPMEQHQEYRWALPQHLRKDMTVHENTRAYFLMSGERTIGSQ